jgi:hypothetical protein
MFVEARFGRPVAKCLTFHGIQLEFGLFILTLDEILPDKSHSWHFRHLFVLSTYHRTDGGIEERLGKMNESGFQTDWAKR